MEVSQPRCRPDVPAADAADMRTPSLGDLEAWRERCARAASDWAIACRPNQARASAVPIPRLRLTAHEIYSKGGGTADWHRWGIAAS